jgi:DNA-binding transcriptional MerR regulator
MPQHDPQGIPDKTYYRIGEVARITKVKPYVLRFWESEFKVMSPPKSRSKQRMYRRRDIDTILMIKKLLYEQGFTIKGARRRLAAVMRDEARGITAPPPATLEGIREELEGLLQLIDSGGREANA